ncbi:MAG: PIN domain-containing protein [Desulfobacterales bacterium]|nr:PIN domain-containing protein [Desulfobacterales bacterium]
MSRSGRSSIKKPTAKKAVRVFLDSNVILSGLISDRGAPRICLDLLTLKLPFLIGCTGRFNLMEIERNLKKKMPNMLPVYRRYLPLLNLQIIPLPSPQEVGVFAQTIAYKDAPVLASAIKGKAAFLVTGDKRHFQRLRTGKDSPLQIVTPAEFVDRLLPEILKEMGQID